MKYIRTKDGIWQYNEENNSAERPNIEFQCNQLWLNIKEQDIINQADTIEELCDVLVNIIYDGHGEPHWEIRCRYDRTWKKDFKNDSDWSIYGAIWTDKGLIYVAKMNDKGELELI